MISLSSVLNSNQRQLRFSIDLFKNRVAIVYIVLQSNLDNSAENRCMKKMHFFFKSLNLRISEN